jgi:hypothetical protein
MTGPCMCGDICCPSCGPAQGNSRCPLCNAWASDTCEHFDPETGEPTAEALPLLEAQARSEREWEDQLAKDLDEEAKLAEQFWKERTL